MTTKYIGIDTKHPALRHFKEALNGTEYANDIEFLGFRDTTVLDFLDLHGASGPITIFERETLAQVPVNLLLGKKYTPAVKTSKEPSKYILVEDDNDSTVCARHKLILRGTEYKNKVESVNNHYYMTQQVNKDKYQSVPPCTILDRETLEIIPFSFFSNITVYTPPKPIEDVVAELPQYIEGDTSTDGTSEVPNQTIQPGRTKYIGLTTPTCPGCKSIQSFIRTTPYKDDIEFLDYREPIMVEVRRIHPDIRSGNILDRETFEIIPIGFFSGQN